MRRSSTPARFREIEVFRDRESDRKEAAFVNIVGTMDFESMGKLSKKFDIPQLDSLKSKP